MSTTALAVAFLSAACEQPPTGGDPCANVGCSARGFCLEEQGQAYCACLVGYRPVGLACVPTGADPCEGETCLDHGTCRTASGNTYCDCEAGYVHLHLDDDRCAALECDRFCVPAPRSDADAGDGRDADDAGNELADDSNDIDSATDTLPVCGNGTVESGEECDGAPDRSCGPCGSGTQACAGCHWTTCDGSSGCEPGTTRDCGPCRVETCDATCGWGPCLVPFESCNGIDDDCDAATDEGFDCIYGAEQACATSCASTGTQHCGTGCTWDSCTPPAEICNLQDDDCDGECDEVACRHPIHRLHSDAYPDTLYTTTVPDPLPTTYTLQDLDFFYLYDGRWEGVPGLSHFNRCRNTIWMRHFCTTSDTCEDASNYLFEFSLGLVAGAATCGAVPLHRLFNEAAGEHRFTPVDAERDALVSAGWAEASFYAGYVWLGP